MDSATITGPSPEAVEALLRDELAQGDATLSTATPVLRHLLLNDDQVLFSDEVVARVRGMVADVAGQMLHAQADAALIPDHAAFVAEREEPLAQALAAEPAFVRHVHTLALEAQLTLRLEAQSTIDPVLSPLLQELVAATDGVTAGVAMAVLAAQARFIQHSRRMALPLGELPAELFHKVLLLFRSHSGESEDAAAAEHRLRQDFDESRGRLGLVSRLTMRLGPHALRALDVADAGVAIFAGALAAAAGQERALTVLSFTDRQYARPALALRAAGLAPSAIEEQFVHLHPDIALPEGFGMVSADRAAQLLGAAAANGRD